MKQRVLSGILAAALLLGLLAGCGRIAAESVSVQEQTVQESAGDAGTGQVAEASEMTAVEDVVEEGMEPVYADALRDGVYPVEMKSSSSMFKADHVTLAVENGRMEARLYMSSQAYLYMFPGTAAEAAAADQGSYIQLADAGEELEAFVLPVEALDAGESYAAFSRKKEKWYGRTLLFRADSLPREAFLESRVTTAADLGLSDGEYTVEVTLSGGSGKASVQSPAKLFIQDGAVTAEIVWSSKNYDYMVVDGVTYDPVAMDEASVFLIPVTGFDYRMPVQADTTAMSQPHLIDYTLTFDSSTIVPAS